MAKKVSPALVRKLKHRSEAAKRKDVSHYFDKSFLEEEKDFNYDQVAIMLEGLLSIVKAPASPAKHSMFFEHFLELYLTAYAPDTRASNRIHPSSLESDCPRKIYYDVSKYPVTNPSQPKIDSTLYKIFAIGTFWHTLIQAHLKRAGVLIASEVRVVSRSKFINGRGDGVLFIEGTERLLEIKTISTFEFFKLSQPKENHKYQASLYASELGLTEIHFVYVEKNFGHFKEFVIRPDKLLVKEANDKINLIRAHKTLKTPPKRVCMSEKVEPALSCPFRTQCFQTDKLYA